MRKAVVLSLLMLVMLCSCSGISSPDDTEQSPEVTPTLPAVVIITPDLPSDDAAAPSNTPKAEPRIPEHTFSAIKVSGLSPKDIIGFSGAMSANGWEPVVTCMGDYCDIGTEEHIHKGATIVLISGHGYIGGATSSYDSSYLAEAVHSNVNRSSGRTESYKYGTSGIWRQGGKYNDMVASHQAQEATDWIVMAACSQLSLDTKESIIDAMHTPSGRPLKGVLAYGAMSGGNIDGALLDKFVQLCMNSDGFGKVASAWFAAHQVYDPFLAVRARAALRKDFQNSTLTDQTADAQSAQNDIRFWKLTESSAPIKYPGHDASTIASEILVNREALTTVSRVNIEPFDTTDAEQSKLHSSEAVELDSRVPNDFRLHTTARIIEMDYDGANE